MNEMPPLSFGLDETVLVMNAWRRLCAFMSLIEQRSPSPEIEVLARDLIAPSMIELGELCDRIPPEQLKAAARAPGTWTPNFRDPCWRRYPAKK
jgi:hypothetical protein